MISINRKYFAMLIAILTLSTMFGVFMDNQLDLGVTEAIGDTIDNILNPNQDPDNFDNKDSSVNSPDLPSQETEEPISYPTAWKDGETVAVSYSMQNSVPDFDYHIKNLLVGGTWTIQDTYTDFGLVSNLENWDYTYHSVSFHDYNDDEQILCNIEYKLKTNGRAGTLNYRMFLWSFQVDSGSSSIVNAPTLAGTFSITPAMSDGDGWVQINVRMWQKELSGNLNTNILMTYNGGNSLASTGYYAHTGYNYVNKSILQVEQLRFDPDDVDSNERTQYRYLSANTLEHRLLLQNFIHGTTITCKVPLSWNLSSITPTSTYSWSSNNLVLSDTVEATYDLRFLSGAEIRGSDSITRQSNILAISDKTTDYLWDMGFENNRFDQDFYSPTANYIDSVTLDHQITSEGSISMFLEDHDTTTDYLFWIINKDYTNKDYNSGFESGTYYISFDYYLEDLDSGNFKVEWYKGSTYQSHVICSYGDPKNRWNSFFGLATFEKVSYQFFRFKMDSTGSDPNLMIYIDNIHVFEVNTEIEVIDYQTSQITNTFRVWDSYDNPVIENADVNIKLRDRTANNELIKEWNGYTDEYGKYQVIWKGRMELKEYSLESVCFDSYFHSIQAFSQDIAMDFSDMNGISGATLTNYEDYIKVTNTDPAGFGIEFDPSGTYDFTDIDYIQLELYWDQTTDLEADPRVLVRDPSDYWYYYLYDYDSIDTWNKYTIELREDIWTLQPHDLDITDVDRIYLLYLTFTGGDDGLVEGRMRNVQLIHACKFFFTPQSIGMLDYASKELGDQFNFEDIEGTTTTTSAVLSTVNGTLKAQQNSGNYLTISFGGWGNLDIDSNYYTHLNLRLMSPYANDLEFTIYDSAEVITDTSYGKEYVSGMNNNEWYLFEFDLSADSDWSSSSESTIEFYAKFKDTSAFSGEYYLIDYCYCYYMDSDIGIGESLEYNENGYNDNAVIYGGTSSLVTANGYIRAYLTGILDGYDTDFERNFTSGFDIYIKCRSHDDSLEKILISAYLDDTWKGSSAWMYLSTDWQVFRLHNVIGTAQVWNQLRVWNEADVGSSGYLDVDFIRLVKEDTQILREIDTAYYSESQNNTLLAKWNMDSFNIGNHLDTDLVLKNLTVGDHYITFSYFEDLDEDIYYLQSIWYYTNYTRLSSPYYLESANFYMSDDYCFFSFNTNEGDKTAQIEQNSTILESSLAEGVTASWIKGSAPAFYNITISIDPSGEPIVLSYGYWILGFTNNTYFDPNWKNTVTQSYSVKVLHTNYEEHIRSYYRYITPDIKEYFLEVYSPFSETNITAYLPLTWDQIVVYPSIDWYFENDKLILEDVISKVAYIIKGFVGVGYGRDYDRREQYVAIEKVWDYDFENNQHKSHDLVTSSHNHLNSFEFVSGYQSTSVSGSPAINSTIVSEGFYSMRMDAQLYSGSYYGSCSIHVPYGFYYLSFDYYIESSDGSINQRQIYYRKDGSWLLGLEMINDKEIWQHGFCYIETNDEWYSEIVIYLKDSNDFTIFLDNIRLYEVSTKMKTVAYSTQRISSTVINWDNLEDKGVSTDITLDIRDRIDQTVIRSYDLTTTENGSISKDYKGILLEQELEIRITAWDSYFGIWSYEKFTESTSNWVANAMTSYTLTANTDDKTKGKYSIDFDVVVDGAYTGFGNTLDAPISNFINLDSTQVDYYVIDIKRYGSVSQVWFFENSMRLYDPTYYSAWTDYDDTALDNSWVSYKFDLRDFDNSYADLTDLRQIFWYIDDASSGNTQIRIDNLRFIKSQKLYITPHLCNEIDFAEKELHDGWNWEEGDNEGFTVNWKDSKAVGNGSLTWIKDTGATYSYISYNSETGIEEGYNRYYNQVKFRIWINETDWDIQFRYYDTIAVRSYYLGTSSANQWSIYSMDLSQDSYWNSGNTITQIGILIANTKTNVEVKIDYLYLLHQDNGLETESSMNWEFEEEGLTTSQGNTLDYITCYYGSLETMNGYLRHTKSTDIVLRFWGEHLNQRYLGDNFDKIMLRARASSNTYLTFMDSGVNLTSNGNADRPLITTEWSTYICELGSQWSTSDYLIQIYDSDNVDWIEYDFIRFIRDDSGNLEEFNSYYLINSENNTLQNYVYIDDDSLGYYGNQELIQKELTYGTHTVVYSAFKDTNYQDSCFINSIWYYDEYTSDEPDWQFTRLDFQVLDQQLNFHFATTWNNLSASIYENGSLRGTVNENVVFSWSRNMEYGVIRNVTIVIDDIVLSYFYRNEEATYVVGSLDFLEFDYNRMTIAVSCNVVNASVYVDDNSTTAQDVVDLPIGSYNWIRSIYYGTFQINITFVYDFNDNGIFEYNEKHTILYIYYLFEEPVTIKIQFESITNRLAKFNFESNYYYGNRCQFRVKTANDTEFTAWMYERVQNGSYNWDISDFPLNQKQQCLIEFRVNGTFGTGDQSIVYFEYYYTPYTPSATVNEQDDVINVNTDYSALDELQEDLDEKFNFFGSVVALLILGLCAYGVMKGGNAFQKWMKKEGFERYVTFESPEQQQQKQLPERLPRSKISEKGMNW